MIYDILCFASFDTALTAYRQVRVAPQLKREIGIQAARTIFGKCFFDAEKCADGIQAFTHYRYEVEEAKSDPAGGHMALSRVPRQDWASHAADAFRTAAVMIREPERKKEREAAAGRQPEPREFEMGFKRVAVLQNVLVRTARTRLNAASTS